MVGSGMGTVRVRTEERVHVRELACACSAGAGEYWSKQSFAHLFATKCAANATFYGSGVTLWISGDTGCYDADSAVLVAAKQKAALQEHAKMQWLACFDSALSAAEVGLERVGVDVEGERLQLRPVAAAPCGS